MKPDYNISIREISSKLDKMNPLELSHPEFKKSAVLILLMEEKGEYKLIMTSRSKNLTKHRGEMSFPGGRFEKGKDKSLKDTALRENEEEIGIKREYIQLIGRIHDFPTVTGYIIRPFVGIIKPKFIGSIDFDLNHGEVAALVKIPLSYLFKDNIFMERDFPQDNINFKILSFPFFDPNHDKEFIIWGASAHIITEFLKIIFGLEVRSKGYIRPTIPQILKYKKSTLSSSKRRTKKRKSTKK